jgi:hypothetical protein
MDGAEHPVKIQLSAEFTSSPTPPQAELLLDTEEGKVASVISMRQVGAQVQSVDVLQELRDEIVAVVSFVAREYVTLYPLGPQDSSEVASVDLHSRKADFIFYHPRPSTIH